jgi:hypothetical protein
MRAPLSAVLFQAALYFCQDLRTGIACSLTRALPQEKKTEKKTPHMHAENNLFQYF